MRPSAGLRARITLAVAVLTGLACALAVAFDRPGLVRYSQVTPPNRPLRTSASSRPPVPPTGPDGSHPVDMTGFDVGLARLFFVLVGAIVLLVLGWLTVAVVRSLQVRRRRRHAVPVHLAAPMERVAEGVDAAIGSLSLGTPDDAIIRCWVELQRAAREVGVEPRPSETSAELTVRLLDDLDVDRTAVARLAALYREARFSSHPLQERDRAAARDALETIRTGLVVTEPADA